MSFLYKKLIQESGKRYLTQIEIPNYIIDNLKHKIMPYQKEAFQRFIVFLKKEFNGKPNKPYHLLYNMDTGSGKTLIMAGLILCLYEKGYRNFLFFVNSNNIIQKTKDNFLNPQTSKYLFKKKIVIQSKEIQIKEVENFEEADTKNTNIKFTTIQQLHIDLNDSKENSVTYEDFENKKIVLITDETHHPNSGTRRADFVVEDSVIVELKAQINLEDVHLAQEKNYRLAYDNVDLLINFGGKNLQFKKI